MQVVLIGLGLIGGSVARDLRRSGFASGLTGVEASAPHAAEALRLGLVDRVDPLPAALATADLVVLAVPVDAIRQLLPEVLDRLPPHAVALDLGSTKLPLVAAVHGHARRGRYVATHPMAGTAQSGPGAALDGLFAGRIAILCDGADSDADAVARAEAFYSALRMRVVRMDSATHDRRAALVSHAAHVLSYALATTALETAATDPGLFDLAGGGFASMARLAQSHAAMWVPILRQNRAEVGAALDALAATLNAYRAALAADDEAPLRDLIAQANRIRSVLQANHGGSGTP